MRQPDWYEGDGAWLWDEGWDQVVKLLEKSAEAGFGPALVTLGDMRRDGFVLEMDHAEAMRLYRKAIKFGDIDAIGRLGDMFWAGEGVPIDEAKGLRLIKKAAEGGSAEARFNLALKILFGHIDSDDKIEALKFLALAAEDGHDVAFYVLGVAIAKSRELPPTAPWLVNLMSRSAAAGGPWANAMLAMFFEFGLGTPEDQVSARRFYEAGAKAGESDSAISLARFLFQGLGGPVDKDEARAWLERVMDPKDVNKGLRRLSARYLKLPWPWSDILLNR